MPETAPAPHRWRQFSLRTLMALMLLCCIGLVIWTRHIEPARRNQRLMAEVQKLGGSVHAQAFDTSWTQPVFGEGYFIEVDDVRLSQTKVDDDWLKHLQHAPRLRGLGLFQTAVGDAGLAHLRGLKRLESLWLSRTKVTDVGLANLASLTRLKQLYLTGCPITDSGLVYLQNLKELEELNLTDTSVSDAGIARLTGLSKLKILHLDHTKVTHASLAHLKKLPALRQVTIEDAAILPSALWYELPNLENHKLARALPGPTVVEFVETPLSDVVDYLGDYHKLAFGLDRTAFGETGVDLEAPVTVNVRCRLDVALEQMLKPLGLKCVQWHQVLLITADKPNPIPFPRLVLGPDESLSKELVAALHKPTAREFVEIPLAIVLSDLSASHGLTFVIDENEIDAAQPHFSGKFQGIAAATALELVLNDLDLHAVIKDNKLHVHAGPIPREPQERQSR